jgi:hypothetical protein
MYKVRIGDTVRSQISTMSDTQSFGKRKALIDNVDTTSLPNLPGENNTFSLVDALSKDSGLVRDEPTKSGVPPLDHATDKMRRVLMCQIGKGSKTGKDLNGVNVPTWFGAIVLLLRLWNLGKSVQLPLLDQFLSWFERDSVTIGPNGIPTVLYTYLTKTLMLYSPRVHKEWAYYNDFIQWFKHVGRTVMLCIASDPVYKERWMLERESFENPDYADNEDKCREFDRCEHFAWLVFVFNKTLLDQANVAALKNKGELYQPLKDGYTTRFPIFAVNQFLNFVGGFSVKLYLNADGEIDLVKDSVMSGIIPAFGDDPYKLQELLKSHVETRRQLLLEKSTGRDNKKFKSAKSTETSAQSP